MAEFELQYLHEIGRLRPDAATVLSTLALEIGLARSDAPLAPIVAEARAMDSTRDPFDRLVAAEAVATGAHLVTKDTAILEHCRAALW